MTNTVDFSKLTDKELALENFAKKLALALADEVIYHGEDNCSECSLELLAEARKRLGLSKEFDELDSLSK